MSHAAHRLSSIRTCLLFQLAVYLTCCLPLVAPAQIADERALRHLAEEFYIAYQKQDLEKLMSMWSPRSPDSTTSRKVFQETFAAAKIELKDFAIRKITLEGDNASVRVAVEMSAVDAETDKSAVGFGKMNRTLHFIKEAGGWKVWRHVVGEEELAVALAAAKTEAERKTLLADQKELVTTALVDALIKRGDGYLNQGDYANASSIFALAQNAAREVGDKLMIAAAMRRVGIVHYRQGNYMQALTHFQESLKLSEEVGDKAEIAAAQNNIANVYQVQADYARALEYFQKSLKLSEELGNKARIAITLNSIGSVYISQGDYARALEYYQRSLMLREELADRQGVAFALTNIGNVYQGLGDYAQALEYYRRSLKLKEEIGNKASIHRTLTNIGTIHYWQGDYARALEYYQRSLRLSQELGDQETTAGTLHNIGNVHKSQRSYAQALEYYERSQKLAEELGYKATLAHALSSIGSVHYWQGDYAQASEYYQKGLRLAEELGLKANIVDALNNIGNIDKARGDYARASEYYQKGLRLAEKLGYKEYTVAILGDLADLHYLQGNYTKAAELAERTASLASQIGSPEHFWYARATAGKSYYALNLPERARQALNEAIASIEKLRVQVAGGEEDQQRFFEAMVSPFSAMVDLLIDQNNVAEAFSYAERAKGRVLLDVLQGGRTNINKAMTDVEKEEEQRLYAGLVSLNTQIYREKVRAQPDQTRLSDLNARLQKTRLEFEAFQTNLYAAHPELKVHRGQTRPFNLEEAGTLLTDNKTALLEFVVTDEKTYLFALTKGKPAGQGQLGKPELRVYSLEIKRQELADETSNFRRALSELDLEFRKPARQLYSLLLKPAEEQLQGKTKLCIVPDGPLWELPFQALQPIENRYLVEDRAIFYTPSLSVLREMTKSARRGRADETGFTTGGAKVVPVSDRFSPVLLAFANPSLNTGTVERVRAVHRDEKLEPLPEAEKEVRILEQLYGAARSKVYTGADAREERAKSEMGKYRILHFATHGILDDQNPMYSNVLLSQAGDNEAEDGLLEAWEIMRLDLKADLTVLSACQTARGRVGAGEGMIGMSWAFFVAGSPTTVVSQWRVDSASTKQLMVEFHRRLISGAAKERDAPTKAEALRGAAVSLLRDRRYRHPFYWSGFVIVGDGR